MLLGCPVAAARVRTEGKHRPVRSANATRFCSVQCRCRRTVRYRSRVTGTKGEQSSSWGAAHPPGSSMHRAHLARGKQRGLPKLSGIWGSSRSPDRDFPGLHRLCRPAFRGGFLLYGVLVSRPRGKGAVRAADSTRPASFAQSAAARKPDHSTIRGKCCPSVTRRAVAVAVTGGIYFFGQLARKAPRKTRNAWTEGSLFHNSGRSRSRLP